MVKLAKFNTGSSLERTKKCQSPQCYITSYIEISPLVPEKKIFEGFVAYMGVAANLVM